MKFLLMGISSKNSSIKFIEVSEANLKEGMLTDRPLYIFLSKNEKYIELLHAYHPLEARILKKLRKSGKIFSSLEPGEIRLPEIHHAASQIKTLCESYEKAGFEKNHSIFLELKTVLEKTLKDTSTGEWDPTATESGLIIAEPLSAVYFIAQAFSAPVHGSLEFLENLSVECFEKSLNRAALCGMFALVIGYSDAEFIRQYVTAVFYEEVRNWVNEQEEIPETKKLDSRFKALVKIKEMLKTEDHRYIGAFNDELRDLVDYVRWLIVKSESVFYPSSDVGRIKTMAANRVFKKIRTQLHRVFSAEKRAA